MTTQLQNKTKTRYGLCSLVELRKNWGKIVFAIRLPRHNQLEKLVEIVLNNVMFYFLAVLTKTWKSNKQ